MDDAPAPPKSRAATPRPSNFGEMTLTYEQALARKSKNAGPIEELFFAHTGRVMDKWLQYLPLYDRAFAPYRGFPIRMLEIGVFQGGSLELWRKYFGPEAVLYGVDIDPACARRVDAPSQVRIGSQDDPEFLKRVVAEMGGIEIVLDDGSHIASHQRVSFQTLWPLLSPGGVYVIEDLHTSYWPKWEGGLRQPGTGIEIVKALIDDMHAWYHTEDEGWASRDEIGSILIADSIVAIRKTSAPLPLPGRVTVGKWEA